MEEKLIAPCGINCGVCSRYLALRHDIRSRGINIAGCNGCRARNRLFAFIKRGCNWLTGGKAQYCYECPDFPCTRLLNLDKTYQTKFRLNPVANLECIRDRGINALLESEALKWRCPSCGGVICCHNGLCFACSLEKLRRKKQKYRWED